MLKATEKGFTLIELLVALAILGAIMGVMSAAVITIMKTNSQNTEWNVNLRQVQNAGHWITRDALMAQVVVTQTPGHFPLTLSWSDWDGNNFNVTYRFDQNNPNTLVRQVNGGAAILIAQNIVTDNRYTNCNWSANDQKLTVKIRASLNGGARYAEGTYEISPRPANRGG